MSFFGDLTEDAESKKFLYLTIIELLELEKGGDYDPTAWDDFKPFSAKIKASKYADQIVPLNLQVDENDKVIPVVKLMEKGIGLEKYQRQGIGYLQIDDENMQLNMRSSDKEAVRGDKAHL